VQVRPTGPGPTKTRFGKRDSENGIRKTGLEKRDSKKRDSALSRLGLTKTDSESEIRKNEIRKNEQNGKRDSKNEILNLRGFGKRDSEKTGFGLQADWARPSKNWIISVCALQLQLQSFKPINKKKWAIL